ncbi:MAG: hypothetical protein FWH00_03595 [Oscillospiraceae bacterium]|nr:hypothetical protein [Oscillospiraceae bacterium]
MNILHVLKDRSGMSMLFVLGIMALLLAVGVSVIAAAGANTGLAVRQENYNRAMLLDNSVHRGILHSLNNTPLSQDIIMDLYNKRKAFDGADDEFSVGSITLDTTVGGDPDIAAVTLTFPVNPTVSIADEIPEVIFNPVEIRNDAGDIIETIQPDPIPPVPETAIINADITVIVVVGGVESRAVYRFKNGELRGGSFHDYGEWELVRYERIV